jgi:hypothetical protein
LGIIRNIGIVVVAVLLIGVLALGYFGFVPGLSDIMGANKPRDLGVTSRPSDLENANAKLGVTIKTLPQTENGADSLTRSGEQQVAASFTSAELTALFNDHASRWKYYPIKDIQINIHDDGVVEVSGVLQVDRFKGFADAIGIPEGTRSEIRPYLSYVTSNPSIYIKGTLQVSNGVAQSNIEELQVGKFVIPTDQLRSIEPYLQQFIQDRADGRIIHINSASFSSGKVDLNLEIPAEIGLTPP